ncbi:nuclease EXOG, mitochondrial-like isoform X3 [Acanthaster planci]|uniref:Nuclease EXOG, mitochondrial n=1 Tax=Acanthaster planci TaxID=133434 RepID=A0A8B7XTW1_ACAPL|nr:nuclease EXOG, mitochondrial-like isoform X3 [Acanthaster planci]
MAARFFGGGFASGAVTSVALYSLYAYVLKPFNTEPRLKRTTKEDSKDILRYGAPDRGPDVRYYSNHALSYDRSKKTPLWVAEHITQADLQGPAHRKHSNFVMDPNIQAPFASQNSDYKRSGWSRGHMAPAGDNKYSQAAMDESFYLSNIVPQDVNNNGNFWHRIEIYCRSLAKRYKDVWVITGPLALPTLEEGGKKYVKYEVIGKNNVAVPTHLYKLITVVLPPVDGNKSDTSSTNETVAVGAFVVPNEPIPVERHLKDFQVSLENLTESAGLHFLSNLQPSVTVRNLCDVDSCKLITQQQLQLHIIGRRLEGATTLPKLEDSWRQLEEWHLEPDDNLWQLYQRRRVELEETSKQKPNRTDSI